MYTIGKLLTDLQVFSKDQNIWLMENGRLLVPDKIASWRGSYDQPALGYHQDISKPCKLGDFLSMLKNSLNLDFHGYKGGLYSYRESHALYVENWGEYSLGEPHIARFALEPHGIVLHVGRDAEDGEEEPIPPPPEPGYVKAGDRARVSIEVLVTGVGQDGTACVAYPWKNGSSQMAHFLIEQLEPIRRS